MKSGNLNFLETSGPLQACNETASPFYFVYMDVCHDFPFCYLKIHFSMVLADKCMFLRLASLLHVDTSESCM